MFITKNHLYQLIKEDFVTENRSVLFLKAFMQIGTLPLLIECKLEPLRGTYRRPVGHEIA